MEQPTAADIRLWGPPLLDWDAYGFGVPQGSDPDPLDVRVGWAVGTLYAVTGRTLASITSVEEVPIAQKVLTAFAVMEAMGGGTAALKVLEAPWLKSFAAGSYREERFSPQELAGGQAAAPPYPPALWALLWALMTDAKKDEWLERLSGVRRPAGTFIQPDWGGRRERGPLVSGSGVVHPWDYE